MKTIASIALLTISTLVCTAADLAFDWTPAPGALGYNLYVATNTPVSSNAVFTASTAATNATWSGWVPGQMYWCYVTATNAYLEGLPSQTVQFQVPNTPGKPRVKIQ